MPKHAQRTITDIEDESGYEHGSPEFRTYVRENSLDVVGDKRKPRDAPKGKKTSANHLIWMISGLRKF